MYQVKIKPGSVWLDMELDEDTQIALTFQLANIGDANIYCNRTNNISFPKSDVNKLNIQNAQIPNSAGTVQYTKIQCQVLDDGLDMLQDSYMIINSIKDKIEATIYSGNFNLISTLGEKKLSDLDLSDYDLTYCTATFDNQKAVYAGVKYPLIDWFSDSPIEDEMSMVDRKVYMKFYRPVMFLHTIINSIITSNGFTYGSATSPVLLNDMFLKLLIPVIDQRSITLEDMGYATKATDTGWLVNGYYDLIFDNIFAGAVNLFQFFEIGGGVDPTIFNVTATGRYTMYYEHVATISFAGSNWENGFVIKNQSGTVLFEYHEVVPGGFLTAILQKDFEVELTKDDIIHIEVYAFNPNGYTIKFDDIDWEISKNADQPIGIGNIFTIANNLPDITQIELLKWFLQIFGCFVKQTRDYTIWFKTIDEMITDCDDPASVDDWSELFAPDEDSEIGFITDLAQKNNFKYSEDDPIVATRFDSFITIDDKTIQPEQDYIQSQFAATEKNIRMSGLSLPSIKAIKDFEWSEGYKPRILIDNVNTPEGAALTVDDGFSTQTVTTNFPMCYFVNPVSGDPDLTMQSIITENYIGFSSVYNHPKIIKQKFWLSRMTIYNFDHFRPKYIKQLGGYYIVMKINGWINNQPTECELLKIL